MQDAEKISHNVARADKTACNELFAPEFQNVVLSPHSPKSSLVLRQRTVPDLFRVFFDLDDPNTVSMKRFPLFSTGNRALGPKQSPNRSPRAVERRGLLLRFVLNNSHLSTTSETTQLCQNSAKLKTKKSKQSRICFTRQVVN